MTNQCDDVAKVAEGRALWASAVQSGEDYPCPYWGIASCFYHYGGNCMGECRFRDEYLQQKGSSHE